MKCLREDRTDQCEVVQKIGDGETAPMQPLGAELNGKVVQVGLFHRTWVPTGEYALGMFGCQYFWRTKKKIRDSGLAFGCSACSCTYQERKSFVDRTFLCFCK